MIILGLQKHDAGLTSLGVGCWVVFGSKVFFRCPDCAGLYDARAADVTDEGLASFGDVDGPFFFCQTPACGFVRAIKFEGWKAFDVFEVKGEP